MIIETIIDLWTEELDCCQDHHAYYWGLLDFTEQTKALRFVQAKHRQQYITSHGKLRIILASYLPIEPDAIHYEFGRFGKPYISVDGKTHSLKFNMSHSGNKMVVAVGYCEYLGVDIEIWNNKLDYLTIAHQCFADSEKKAWLALPDHEKPAIFFQLWTRKESFAKAVGTGISLGVSDITTTTGKPTRFVSIPDSYGMACDWNVVDLNLWNEVSGALTVKTNYLGQINFKKL